MNKLEEQYFDALFKDRTENANVLEKRSMRGAKSSVVEKYSDQAHFIYELLQNSDDAKATAARFILEHDRLIFAHNGTRHFSVSNPAEEERDSKEGKLGDINAITSIGNSNKTEASIGKFGVGFKAVFQYTSTPHIYDPDFKFRIDRFIVPSLLEEDFPGRHPDETLFVFPFDNPDRDADEAYNDIADKLKNLSYPLLFLSGLRNIEFRFGNVIGLYGKTISQTRVIGNTLAEFITLTQNDGEDIYDERLWLFSRRDEYNRRYSVGFFVDEEGHLIPKGNEPAFCFFPTKEVTGLNFIVHAPFLLTDSREGIRAGIPHNDRMLNLLASLSADAFVYLRDIGIESGTRLINDDIVNIIPVDPNQFSKPSDKRKVSFLPFYLEIQIRFNSDCLLPTADGYAGKNNSYWASATQLPKLFSDAQLGEIAENENARWVFLGLARDEIQRSNKALFAYLDKLVKTGISEDNILSGRSREFYYNYNKGIRQSLTSIKGITAEFIEAQSFDWLHRFYKWISETKHRTDTVKNKSVFIDRDGNAAAAYDNENQLILFLPTDNITGYKIIHPELLNNPDTKKFIEGLGIKQPSLKDQIYNTILPQYTEGADRDTDSDFVLFFNYYCKCSNEEVGDFVNLIKGYEFLTYYDENEKKHRGRGSDLYMPSDDLTAYFETKPGTHFVDLAQYKELIGPEKEKHLDSFLYKLGVKKNIDIVFQKVDPRMSGRKDLPRPMSTRGITWTETVLDGCKEITEYIHDNRDETKSILLWNTLINLIETKCSPVKPLSSLLYGTVTYFYRNSKSETFESSSRLQLSEKAWIKDVRGNFVSPKNLYRDSIADIYDTSSKYAEQLMDFLGIRIQIKIEDKARGEDNSLLTDSQKEKIEFADKIKALGIGEEDLEDLQEFKRQKEARKRAAEQQVATKKEMVAGMRSNSECPDSSSSHTNIETEEEDYFDSFNDESDMQGGSSSGTEKRKLNKTTSRVVKDIVGRTRSKPSAPEPSHIQSDEDIDVDQDEFIPAPIDYSKRIEKAKQKSADEIDKIVYYEELQAKAMKAPKYSYGWFTALLEMESISSSEANANSKEVSISFAKVEREADTKRTLVLKHPDRYIPQFMEDLADIPLVLHMGTQTKTVAIEVANIKSYTLRVKVKNAANIEEIDLSSVEYATINAQSPGFLLEELKKQFEALGKEADFDMQKNLCENIEFIFGPPGTGKTTHLAKNVLLPMMKNNINCRVLVLTPTNKSADVLVKRIMETAPDNSYEQWLVRFGATGDEEIEQSPVFKDKTFDIGTKRRNVTVTTIARFPYDYFMPQGNRMYLRGIKWDYIVIDEASMIPLANIVLPLYKKTPRKFIIAGDPFQIEPITSVDLWKNENIYTMVQLDSFTNPKTVPHQYKVELLTTQYRSVPEVGTIFSSFAYGGILKHYRNTDSRRPLNLSSDLGVETINIIKFPVSKYESIYRCKRLQHSSSYQVYSALFTFEYVCYLSRAIAENNPGSLFKIGVIAPYRAQADLIDKLIASDNLPKEVDVQVGTIHGFQGDECDIIFVVFNTPPTISSSKDMFLNKRNIINVSISRARDYLFMVMPDDNTENIENLRLVKRVEQLAHSTNAWQEFLSPDLEQLMFGDSQYLENNAFSTSHQSVNVYGLPEKCYEVRTEESAVDVQIHKAVSVSNNTDSET